VKDTEEFTALQQVVLCAVYVVLSIAATVGGLHFGFRLAMWWNGVSY
jgi:hypothetical protein